MKILAIESSCDETAAAVVEDGRKILSTVVASQVNEHALYGGVVPEIASRRHCESISQITKQALDEANTSLEGIEAVAVTSNPGLIGALLVGVNFAKGISLASGLPLVSVHHLRGHIASNYIAYPNLTPPFLCLVVSGGHSHVVMVSDYTHFEVIAKTRDDAAGEAFDKAARAMGLPYPGGIYLDREAEKGDDTVYALPRPRVDGSPLDYSFSGLKTAVINIIHKHNQKNEAINVPDMCASFRKRIVEILLESLFTASEQTGTTKIVVAGGVAANSLLRKECKRICCEKGCECYLPPIYLCGDNAAMIGAQGYFEFLAGNTTGLDLNAKASCEIG